MSSSQTNAPSQAQPDRPADALLRAEQTMAQMRDLTFRGTYEAPDGDHVFAGQQVTTTLRITADGSCEQVHETADGVRQTTRTIGGTVWFSWSDEFLDLMGPDFAEQARGLWQPNAADPADACDITRLSEGLDLDTVERVGGTRVMGRQAVEYVAVSAHPEPKSKGLVRFWITRGSEPVVVQIAGEYAFLLGPVVLTSSNDGFSIPEPPRDLWLVY